MHVDLGNHLLEKIIGPNDGLVIVVNQVIYFIHR